MIKNKLKKDTHKRPTLAENIFHNFERKKEEWKHTHIVYKHTTKNKNNKQTKITHGNSCSFLDQNMTAVIFISLSLTRNSDICHARCCTALCQILHGIKIKKIKKQQHILGVIFYCQYIWDGLIWPSSTIFVYILLHYPNSLSTPSFIEYFGVGSWIICQQWHLHSSIWRLKTERCCCWMS